jgi:hypothetical protein
MSSTLRSTSVPVGYFVMSKESLIGGSGEELFVKTGDNTYTYDPTLWNLTLSGSAPVTYTFRDLGLTKYYESGDSTYTGPAVDLRKVQLVSGLAGGVAGTAFDASPRYVPLGTVLKSSTPYEPAAVKSSVFLVGKIL